MRILGIDYGRRWVGIAVSDELAIAARGIGTHERTGDEHLLNSIARIATEYEVDRIVIGYPVRTDGQPGELCSRIDKFAVCLEQQAGLPVIKWDEAFSTSEAEEILKLKGMHWRERKRRVDELAAVLILQDYLNRAAGTDHQRTENYVSPENTLKSETNK